MNRISNHANIPIKNRPALRHPCSRHRVPALRALLSCRSTPGFTLVELIIGMALMLIVIAGGFSMLLFGQRVFASSAKEFDLQAQTRLAMEKTNQIVRYSTALFTIPQSSFREGNLDTQWDYIGIQPVVLHPANGANPAVMGTELVSFRYNATSGGHDKTVIIPANEEYTVKLVFDKVSAATEDNLLQYSIEMFRNGQIDAYGRPASTIVMQSELESLNALQIIDQGSAADPAVALAFRTDARPSHIVGHVAMVLDTSGSMDWDMNGNRNVADEDKRNSILKSEASKLIEGLSTQSNVEVSLVPFSTNANNPKSFLNAKTDRSELLDQIDDLGAVGGTNTGDGIRRAYWQLYNAASSEPAGYTVSNYCIILVDGQTTYASWKSGAYFVNDGNITDSNLVGDGSSPYGTAYEAEIGKKIKGYATTYVIAFSNVAADRTNLDAIATACGAKSKFTAGNAADLNNALEAIRQDIVNSLWVIKGPKL